MLFPFADETFDLPNAGKVIVQERIHRRRSSSLQSVTAMRGERIPKRAASEKRHRRQTDQRQRRADIKHHPQHDHHLQQCDHPLLDPIDQHPLDRVHILQNARHQIARRAIIKPAQRQQLDMRIKIAPQIEDHLLLEGVV